ncbi:ABC transporter permease [Faecalicatena orotica]|nr:ABC transporter permease [Faecalicatena orotica]
MSEKMKRFYGEYAVGIFLVILFLACILFIPKFGSITNLMNISTQIAINGLMATGMTFVILTGGIDLSVGAVAAVACVLASALCLKLGDMSVLGCLGIFLGISLVLGSACGLFTGFFVNKLKVPPFIASLATCNICRGAAYLYTNAQPIHGMTKNFQYLGMKKLGNVIPVCVILLVIVIAAAWFYLKRTCGGRYVFSVGSSEEVSKLCGINVQKVKYICYVVSGVLACLAGCVYCSKLTAGQPNACDGYELNAIAAVAMGGTSMSGGKGGIRQTVFGILIIGIINNAMNLLGINAYWQKVVLGFIILAAVVSDTAREQAAD